ncbi:MAG: hypothetical protein U0694_17285 [Anaerolineae bacterium]
MTTILSFIERISTGLYILLGISAAVFFIRWRQVRRDYLDANFELVRDITNERQRRVFIRWFSLAALAVCILLIQQVVIPYVRNTQQAVATSATLEPTFITTTPQPVDAVDINDLVSGNSGGPDVTPTVTMTPVGTIMPNAPPPIGCDNPQASLQIPQNGMRVFETIQVIGTANAANFASYKLELSGPGTSGIYAVISEVTTAVTDPSPLGQIVAMAFEPGEYQFRLTVFDSSNTLVAACMVNITISPPP